MIFLLRHGQTEFNRAQRLQGRLDSPLTELGVAQARRMGQLLRAHLDAPERWRVVSSPLGRARRTAEIVCEELGLGCQVELDDRLAELSVGEFEGLTREQILQRMPDLQITPGWLYRLPSGEGEQGLRARLSSWLAELDETDGRRRLVVGHGVSGRMLRHLYAGEPLHSESPPQDAVFRLHGGRIERLDGPAAEDALLALKPGQG